MVSRIALQDTLKCAEGQCFRVRQLGSAGPESWLGTVARLAFGPGYRLYLGKHGKAVILLLLGGDKGSQAKDIRRAKRYWMDFLEALKHGKA